MAVFRIERTKDYTVMSNHHLRNHELSLKASGIKDKCIHSAFRFIPGMLDGCCKYQNS